jgi:hypothetical protein
MLNAIPMPYSRYREVTQATFYSFFLLLVRFSKDLESAVSREDALYVSIPI